MIQQSDGRARGPSRWRRWAIRVGVACLALEALYLIVGNLCLRLGVLEDFINDESDQVFISWDSGVTILPGRAAFRGFTYRGQTEVGQTYLHLARVGGRVSLIGLLFKTVDDIDLTGEGVEILGWVHIRDQVKNGRIFARHGARSVGVALDDDIGKVVTIKSRAWFEKQEGSSTRNRRPAGEESK